MSRKMRQNDEMSSFTSNSKVLSTNNMYQRTWERNCSCQCDPDNWESNKGETQDRKPSIREAAKGKN